MSDSTGTPEHSTEDSDSPVGLIIVGVIATIIAIFIISNTQEAAVNFAWLDASLPLWSVIVISVALGVVIGWAFSAWRRRRKSHSRN
jgi:uncharacterized integral membrane protein